MVYGFQHGYTNVLSAVDLRMVYLSPKNVISANLIHVCFFLCRLEIEPTLCENEKKHSHIHLYSQFQKNYQNLSAMKFPIFSSRLDYIKILK